MTFVIPGLPSFPSPLPASIQKPHAPPLPPPLLLLFHLSAPPYLPLPTPTNISLFPYLRLLHLTWQWIPVPSRQSPFQKGVPKGVHRPLNLTPILIQNLRVAELEGMFGQSEGRPHPRPRHRRMRMRSRFQLFRWLVPPSLPSHLVDLSAFLQVHNTILTFWH